MRPRLRIVSTTTMVMPDDILQFLRRKRTPASPMAATRTNLRICGCRKAKGPHPLVINIHGGFWRAKYDLEHAGFLCAALTRRESRRRIWNIAAWATRAEAGRARSPTSARAFSFCCRMRANMRSMSSAWWLWDIQRAGSWRCAWRRREAVAGSGVAGRRGGSAAGLSTALEQ